jgi:hypothetical protein
VEVHHDQDSCSSGDQSNSWSEKRHDGFEMKRQTSEMPNKPSINDSIGCRKRKRLREIAAGGFNEEHKERESDGRADLLDRPQSRWFQGDIELFAGNIQERRDRGWFFR